MTRILTFNYEYPPLGGGGGYLCRDVMEEFVSQGHEVTVITSAFADLVEQETVNGVEILRVPVLARKGQNSASILSMLSYY
ncbi:MAG: glycosyltransferase family 4 protein, partial [Gammaproteobacteria bacterium]